MLHKNSASPFGDWQAKNFHFFNCLLDRERFRILTCSSALRLCVWLFDNDNILLLYADKCFLFALRAVKRIVFQYRILSDFVTGFISANRTAYPFCILHKLSPSYYSINSIYSSKQIPCEYISKAASLPTYL